MHPGRHRGGAGSPTARKELARARRGRRDPALARRSTPAQRVGIYHGMYLLRMEEALATDYPAPQALPGRRRLLRARARTTCRSIPSRSYSLNRLGDHLPGVRARRRPACGAATSAPTSRGSSSRVGAGVRRARDEGARRADVIARSRPRPGRRAVLAPIAAFRLLALRYPANAYLRVAERRRSTRIRRRGARTRTSRCYRRDYAVYRHDLTRAAHDLLADLARGHAARRRGRGRAQARRAAPRRSRTSCSSGSASGSPAACSRRSRPRSSFLATADRDTLSQKARRQEWDTASGTR